MLRHYIRHALPLLRVSGDDNNPFLFPGRFGGHLERDGLSRGSRRLIALRTGIVGVTSHKSRHVGVKLHLAENPGDYETAREHTGHRDVDTTKRIYAMVNQVAASKRVHKSMGKY